VIGREIGKKGKTDIGGFSALAELLWTKYGREGRITAAHLLSSLNESDPERIIPLCRRLVESCVSWEECDTMTYGIEPVIRKDPEGNAGKLVSWLADENKWVKRAALNVIARLPMKKPHYTAKTLSMIVPCLTYADADVRRTCSFAIRMSARGDAGAVLDFLKKNIGGDDPTKIWIFSDAMRSMTRSFLPKFTGLLPAYKRWRSRIYEPLSLKSLDAAISVLEKAS
jgi:hypothetical protein